LQLTTIDFPQHICWKMLFCLQSLYLVCYPESRLKQRREGARRNERRKKDIKRQIKRCEPQWRQAAQLLRDGHSSTHADTSSCYRRYSSRLQLHFACLSFFSVRDTGSGA